MSRKLDPETEDLLWAAAENDRQSVRDEFEKRFPHLRAELATRRVMVEVLRKSKPHGGSVRQHFMPTASTRAASRRLVWVPAVAVLLAALAFGGYIAARYIIGSPEGTAAGSQAVHQAGSAHPSLSAPEPSGGDPRLATGIAPMDPETGRDLGVGERPPNPAPQPKLVVLPAETTLLEAIRQIGSQGGVRLDVLPGVQDVQVRLFGGNSGDTAQIPFDEAIRLVERAGRVRILANGPGAYLVFPGENSNEGAPFGPIRAPNE